MENNQKLIEDDAAFELDNEEELFEHYRFKVDPGQEIIRIDKYLLDRLPNTSRNKIQVAAKNGNVHVNGKKEKQNYKVKPGDEVAFDVKIFPNPTADIIQIILPQEDNNFEKILFDQTGRILLKTNENQIDLTNFSSGYFFLQIPQVSQKSWKVVKH